jgi:hypothetical protein
MDGDLKMVRRDAAIGLLVGTASSLLLMTLLWTLVPR